MIARTFFFNFKMFNNTTCVENCTLSPKHTDDESVFSISREDYEQFMFISNIAKPIICVFGLIGNILGLGVLWKDTRQQRLSIYAYLCSLTFCDSIYLALGLVRTVPLIIEYYNAQLAHYIDQHMDLGTIYLDMVFSHTSTAILVVMSLERFNAVFRPFAVKSSWLSRFPWSIIAACALVNIVFLLPFPINFEVTSFQTADNETNYVLQFRQRTAKTMDIYMIVQTFVDYFIPTILLLISNIGIPMALARTTKHSQILNGMANKQQTKVTLTVFFITLLYLLLAGPNLFIKIIAFIDDEYSFDGKKKLMFWLFIEISNLFAYLNAANDWIIYVVISNHYRHVFKDMYCRCCFREQTTFSWSIETPEVGRSRKNLESNTASTVDRY